MRDDLALFFTVILLIVGSVLLYDGVSVGDASQSARVIGGAAVLSAGLILMRSLLKNWWEWKKLVRRHRNGQL
jgi:hypothetical protein